MDFARLVAAHQERRLRFVFDAWTQRTLSLTVSALQATSRWRKSILISAMRSWRKARRGILYRSRMAAERRETELVRKFFRYWKRCRVIRRKKAVRRVADELAATKATKVFRLCFEKWLCSTYRSLELKNLVVTFTFEHDVVRIRNDCY